MFNMLGELDMRAAVQVAFWAATPLSVFLAACGCAFPLRAICKA
jgi:hypothetical protein